MSLFRTRSEEGISIDEIQLKMMVNLLGRIPKEMIKEGNNASQYFDRRGIVLSKERLIS